MTSAVPSACDPEADGAGIATPAEGAGRDSLRERNTVSLRSLAASREPGPLGFAALPVWLVVGQAILAFAPTATSEALGVTLLCAGVSLGLSASTTAAWKPAAVAVRAGA